MRFLYCAFFCICLISAAFNAAEAKTIREVGGPAEAPPATFQGKQYVDSRGCVFIRAGYGGSTTWVPRVNRKREVYCSKKNKPSLTHSQLAALGSVPAVVNTEPKKKSPASQTGVSVLASKQSSEATLNPVKKRTARNRSVSGRTKPRTIALNRQLKTLHSVATKDLTTAAVTIDPDVTAAGDAQMEQIWTNTVPRRLITRKVRAKSQ